MRFFAAAAILFGLLLAAGPGPASAARRTKAKARVRPAPAARQASEAALPRDIARSAARTAPEPQPGSAAWLLDRAKALMESKEYATAAAAARRAAALVPEDPKPRVTAADALYALGDYPGAFKEANEALGLDPASPEARRIAALAKGRIPSLATTVVESADQGTPKAAPPPPSLARKRWLMALGGAGVLLGCWLAALVARRHGKHEPAGERPPRAESYRIVREIGLGGMGRVYEAVDVHLDRRVAVKKLRDEIRADPRERERFFQEARLVAALRHPNIVLIHSVVEDEDEACLVFEYIDGHTLAQYISHWTRLHFAHAVWVAQGVAAALDYAHSRGVVHRDLKPSNVMITPDGLLKVMDFGVARLAKDSAQSLTAALTVAGTPPYMAPEQEEGKASPQCDVFALAVCVYEMLTGMRPFQGSGAGMVLQKQRQDYIPASQLAEGLPPGIDDTLAWGLAAAPSQRCASAGAFAANLEALLRGEKPGPGECRW